jgi:hypothetical protein
MVAARLELDGLAGLDLKPASDGAHLHDAAFHGHLMDFDAVGGGKRAADQASR